MMNPTTTSPSDLVLRFTSGPRNGEAIPVSTRKCFLGMETNQQEISENPKCVIFRGPAGAVARSYSDEVLFNGEASSVHWLAQGDQINFPNSMTMEVEHLGSIGEAAQASNATLTDAEYDARLDLIEAEIKEIQNRNDQTLSRFENIEVRLDSISDQMTQLVDLSTKNYTATMEAASSDAASNPIAGPVAQETQPQETETPAPESTFAPEPTSSTEVEEVFATLGGSDPVVESPVADSTIMETTSPELSSLDQTQDESVVEYYSHEDDSEEQIMTFSSEAEPETEEVITNGSHVEITDAPAMVETMGTDVSETGEAVLAQAELQAQAEAEAQAARDAEAEKRNRIEEMERIFGGSELTTDSKAQPEPETSPHPEVSQAISANISELINKTISQTSDSNMTSNEPVSEMTGFTNELGGIESTLHSTPDQIQPADEQQRETFDTHSPSEEVAPSADPSLLDALNRVNDAVAGDPSDSQIAQDSGIATEETMSSEASIDESPAELSPLASSLLQQVQVEEELEVEQPTPQETSSLAAPESVEPETAVTPPANESLADVLARMQDAGQWDGVPDEGDPVEPIEPVQEVAVESPVEMESSSQGESESDVEDYMSQLLSRMRGDDEPEKSEAPKKAKKVVKKVEEKKSEPEFVQPENPLTPEEFKPKRKAKKIKSLDAMRELANSTAQTNISVSEHKNKTELGYLQLGIAGGGILMSLYYFLFASTKMFDTGFIVGLTCIAAAAFCLYRYYQAHVEGRKLTSMVSVSHPSDSEPAEPTA